SRRDFLNGVAVGTGGAVASSALPPFALDAFAGSGAAQDRPGYYPPALTGLRGSHAGSFEAAHAERDGRSPAKNAAAADTGEAYDLVIVGGGISGLAAAHFWRSRNPGARILVLDNHDDFGGHAKRNEFSTGGRVLLANGGTWAIESPFPYSKAARGLMDELGIQPAALAAKCYRQDVYKHLSGGVFFDRETFGADRLVAPAPGGRRGGNGAPGEWKAFLEKAPLSPEARRDILRLETEATDYFPGISSDEKKDKLSRMSYRDFLLKVVGVHQNAIPYYQTRTHGLFGVGIDAVPALDCWVLGQPGFRGLKLEPGPHPRMGYTPRGFAAPKEAYEFHYPDGNATIARMLVRKMIPAAAPGHNAEDIVTAKFDYAQLDKPDSLARIRLSSIVVRVRHLGEPVRENQVHVEYVRGGRLLRVLGKSVILACWNMMIPYLCPELPEKQKEALHYGVKVPLVYTSVAIRNWEAFEKLGLQTVACPGMYHHEMNLDLCVDVGGYESPKTPDQPMLVRMERSPCLPGLSERDQHRAGRGDLLATPFETFERSIRDQFQRVLGESGFDPARDITGITVNRWPHGYAYEYNYLFDTEWPAGESPCEISRRRFGRIAIANSDAGAAAYTDSAMDQAWRAVEELHGA
ncbi:MAG TPA: NAD(P)/FAD-dependent oxidoreductase, partial [Candidatus Acidoferrum sp.]|nr:NAD(P)/FAD-dependent oxidoreductase [Candidatus Acidoferrum sp.]